jgi:hypothetical protein
VEPLDRVATPGVDLASAKFGLLIPGNDEVALSNFRAYSEAGQSRPERSRHQMRPDKWLSASRREWGGDF